MQFISLVWGILALLGLAVGFLPCLGALNWVNIPFSAVGLAVSIYALATAKVEGKGGALAGVICCGLAVFFGLIRLALGGGVF
jgi:hypothetical protein